jgi:hypothetical protein
MKNDMKHIRKSVMGSKQDRLNEINRVLSIQPTKRVISKYNYKRKLVPLFSAFSLFVLSCVLLITTNKEAPHMPLASVSANTAEQIVLLSIAVISFVVFVFFLVRMILAYKKSRK